MARSAVSVKLSEQWQDGHFKCYRKMIGGWRFSLSNDKGESVQMALALTAKWRELRRNGQGWTQAAADAVLAPFRPETVKPAMAGRSASLYAAIGDYLADYKGRVSESRYQRHVTALNAYKDQQADCPLASIGWDKLNATVAYFSSRPKSGHGAPMAVATVQTTVKAVYALFDHLDASGQWDAPKRFSRLFRVKYASLRTPLEVKRDGLGPDTFTVDELRSLWQAATPRQRFYLGLALNTGETAQGLADVLKDDLQRDEDALVIDRNRGKTGVRGVYPLWPEVAALVESEMDTEPGEPLLFKTMDGKPLVWFHGTGRVDSISKTWANLLKRCPKVRKLGHKYLRKTGASLVESLTGSDRVAEMYLSHKGNSVAKRHYLARDFGKLADALLLLRDHLAPVFTEATTAASGSPVAA